jgi:hypothetical protein
MERGCILQPSPCQWERRPTEPLQHDLPLCQVEDGLLNHAGNRSDRTCSANCRAGSYKVSAFFCAKTLTTAPVEIVQVFVFAVIVYFMTGYQARLPAQTFSHPTPPAGCQRVDPLSHIRRFCGLCVPCSLMAIKLRLPLLSQPAVSPKTLQILHFEYL